MGFEPGHLALQSNTLTTWPVRYLTKLNKSDTKVKLSVSMLGVQNINEAIPVGLT